MAAHLRVYPLAKDEPDIIGQQPTVRVSLGDLLPLVALAHRHNYLWLQDFLPSRDHLTALLVQTQLDLARDRFQRFAQQNPGAQSTDLHNRFTDWVPVRSH